MCCFDKFEFEQRKFRKLNLLKVKRNQFIIENNVNRKILIFIVLSIFKLINKFDEILLFLLAFNCLLLFCLRWLCDEIVFINLFLNNFVLIIDLNNRFDISKLDCNNFRKLNIFFTKTRLKKLYKLKQKIFDCFDFAYFTFFFLYWQAKKRLKLLYFLNYVFW